MLFEMHSALIVEPEGAETLQSGCLEVLPTIFELPAWLFFLEPLFSALAEVPETTLAKIFRN